MRSFLGAHHPVCAADFIVLALGLDDPLPPLGGIDRDLFRGPLTESGEERAARVDAAADVLADLYELGRDDEVAALDAVYAATLIRTCPGQPRQGAGRGVAA